MSEVLARAPIAVADERSMASVADRGMLGARKLSLANLSAWPTEIRASSDFGGDSETIAWNRDARHHVWYTVVLTNCLSASQSAYQDAVKLLQFPFFSSGTASIPPCARATFGDFADESSVTSYLALLQSAVLPPPAAAQQRPVVSVRPAIVDAARRRAERRVEDIATIQRAFALSIQQLSSVLGRSRTQVYRWLDVNDPVDLQGRSLIRIGQLKRLAETWLSLRSRPLGAFAAEPLSSGGSLLDLLRAEEINVTEAERALTELSDAVSAKPRTLSQQLRARGYPKRRAFAPDRDD